MSFREDHIGEESRLFVEKNVLGYQLDYHPARTRRFRFGTWQSLAYLSLWISFIFWFPIIHASQHATNILIIKSSSESYYNQVINQIKQRLDDYCTSHETACNNIEVQSYTSNESKSVYQQYDLVITLGLKARHYADRYLAQAKTINAMIPRLSMTGEGTSIPTDQKYTIILDQPFVRSLYLIRKIIHPANRVGLLLSAQNQGDLAALSKEAEISGLTLVTEFIEQENDIGRKLSQLLDNIDVLLALPDMMIYNRNTVSQILLSSYRKNIPVIGYSAAYVKAGALAAVYSSPEDIGNDIGLIVTQYLEQKKLPSGSSFPRFFSVSVNKKVGASLGIQVYPKPEEIVSYIKDNTK